jgi:uracil-DNA glycosylase
VIQVTVENNFASWRKVARSLLQNEVAPDEILWTSAAENSLFETDFDSIKPNKIYKVAPEFLALAETVACFDDAGKWALLYRLLFRLIHENRNLLAIESDNDVRRAFLMERAVRRDVHKFHAFVRFRRVEIETRGIFVAWHEPQHFTVRKAAPFFARRFGAMRFSILTPKGCAHWNLKNLIFTEAVARDFAPPEDETEVFWLVYYRSIFNPFRLKIKAMKKEFPVRHWRTLPEAALIPELIRKARETKK